MARLIACLLAVPLFLVATPASACLPPMVFFARGSATLDRSDLAKIDHLARVFRQASPGSRVALDAVGDDTGSAAVNHRMARRRADAVRAALVRLGVPDGSIDILIDIRVSANSRPWSRSIWMSISTRPGCV